MRLRQVEKVATTVYYDGDVLVERVRELRKLGRLFRCRVAIGFGLNKRKHCTKS